MGTNMNTKITLTNPTDDELNAAFAEKVAGALAVCDGMMRLPDAKCGKQAFESWKRYPEWATSADAVLPLLERDGWDWEHRFSTSWTAKKQTLESVTIWGPSKEFVARHDYVKGECTFPRAACIALLRAHGVEVVFTKGTP